MRNARIGIIGLGYVGLPLVIRHCEERFSVTGFDIDLCDIRWKQEVVSKKKKESISTLWLTQNRKTLLQILLICPEK